MKKLFLLMLMLMLAACNSPTDDDVVDGDWNLGDWVNDGSGVCAAPDSTYPDTTSQTWQNLSYDLPWCWTITEATDELGEPTLLRLDHGEGESYVEITVTQSREDLEKNWGPAEQVYGNYNYYHFLVGPGMTEFVRFEGDYKISMITPQANTGSHEGALKILNSLTLVQ